MTWTRMTKSMEDSQTVAQVQDNRFLTTGGLTPVPYNTTPCKCVFSHLDGRPGSVCGRGKQSDVDNNLLEAPCFLENFLRYQGCKNQPLKKVWPAGSGRRQQTLGGSTLREGMVGLTSAGRGLSKE